MKDLIKALQILLKYADEDNYSPTNCSHDQLAICAGIDLIDVSEEDVKELDKLGFFWSESSECFLSFRFGSC